MSLTEINALSSLFYVTSVLTDSCRLGRTSSTLWIRLRKVSPTSWQKMACLLQNISDRHLNHISEQYSSNFLSLLKVNVWVHAKEKLTYLHYTDILSSWQCIDIIFQFHHHFDHFHHIVVDLILRPVQFCCGSWLLVIGKISINENNMSGIN